MLRLDLFALALALVACGSEPYTQPPDAPTDAGPADNGAMPDLPPAVDTTAPMDATAPADLVTPTDTSSPAPTDALPDGCASSTVGNCCGMACSVPTNAMTAACTGGRCVVGMCNAGFGDCDGMAANGCETNLNTSSANCGACRAPCASGRGCVMGTCIECDHDGDGATIPACGGMDCDDNDRERHPGATERCDGFDDDCDGVGDMIGSEALQRWCRMINNPVVPRPDGGSASTCVRNMPRATVMGYERFTMACRECVSRRLVDGGTETSCGCYVDNNAGWLCD